MKNPGQSAQASLSSEPEQALHLPRLLRLKQRAALRRVVAGLRFLEGLLRTDITR